MSDASSLRIAIADDDRSMREILRHMLQSLGHEVVAAVDNGRALIEACASTRPDVVITDNMMPDMTGLEAAATIFAERPVPIVLLSGFCDRDSILDAEQNHIVMYLVKPLSTPNLEAALARCRSLELQACRAEAGQGPVSAESDLPNLGEPSYQSPSAPPYRNIRRVPR